MKKIFKKEYILSVIVGGLLSVFYNQSILMLAGVLFVMIFGVLAFLKSEYKYTVYAWISHIFGLLLYQEYGVIGYITNLVIMLLFMDSVIKIQRYIYNKPIEIETD